MYFYYFFVYPDYCILSLCKGGAHSKKLDGFQMSLFTRKNECSKDSYIYIYIYIYIYVYIYIYIFIYIYQSKEHRVSEKFVCFIFDE